MKCSKDYGVIEFSHGRGTCTSADTTARGRGGGGEGGLVPLLPGRIKAPTTFTIKFIFFGAPFLFRVQYGIFRLRFGRNMSNPDFEY